MRGAKKLPVLRVGVGRHELRLVRGVFQVAGLGQPSGVLHAGGEIGGVPAEDFFQHGGGIGFAVRRGEKRVEVEGSRGEAAREAAVQLECAAEGGFRFRVVLEELLGEADLAIDERLQLFVRVRGQRTLSTGSDSSARASTRRQRPRL